MKVGDIVRLLKNSKNKLFLVSIIIMTILLSGGGTVYGAVIEVNNSTILPNRLAGMNGYQTSAQIADQGWTTSREAVLASGLQNSTVETLAAGALASKKNIPMFLTDGVSIDPYVLNEIVKLGVFKVYVTSGTAVIQQSVLDVLTRKGIECISVYGIDAASTTVEIAKQMAPFTGIVVTGGIGRDALSVASIAGSKGFPILYTDSSGALPTSVANYIKGLHDITNSYIIGGTAIVQSPITTMLPGMIVRYAGTTSYETNLNVLRGFDSDLNWGHVFIANGQTLAEALAGAPLAAMFKAPIVLTDGISIAGADYVDSKITTRSIVTALGGTAIVSEAVLHQIGTTNPLQSIDITTPATKLSYSIGDKLDITGLVVTGTYNDGSTKKEIITAENVTGFNSSTAAIDQVLTINVGGLIVTYKVQIVPQYGPFTYTVTGGKAQITGYTGAGGDVTIPSTLGGYPVISIGTGAFGNCSGLASISIPKGVTDIGGQAFIGCTDLTSISIPQEVTSIGEQAFRDCFGLTTIKFNSSTTAIFDSAETIQATTKIIGYDPSTAKDYATKYNMAFEVVSYSPDTSGVIEIKPASSIVNSSKIWTIKLNGLVNEASIKDKIYITNSQGIKQIPTCTVSTVNGLSQINVKPDQNYTPGDYMLWVRDIETVKGTKLKSQVYLKFTVL